MQGGGFWKQSRNYGTSTYQQCLRSSYCIWIRILSFSVIKNIFFKDSLEYGSWSDPGLLNQNADLDAHPGFFKTNIWKYLELTKYFDILL